MNTYVTIGILIPVIFAAIGQFLVIYGSKIETDKFQKEVEERDSKIISLQQANIDLSNNVKDLTKTIHNISTGEEDYPDVDIKIEGVFLRMKIKHMGKNPIFDLKIRITEQVYDWNVLTKDLLWYDIAFLDLDFSNPITQMKERDWFKGRFIFKKDYKAFKPGQIEDIHEIWILGDKLVYDKEKEIKLPGNDKFGFNIYCESKLQDWIIFLKFNKVNGYWKYAYSVTRVFNEEFIEKKHYIEPDFGFDEKELSWLK